MAAIMAYVYSLDSSHLLRIILLFSLNCAKHPTLVPFKSAVFITDKSDTTGRVPGPPLIENLEILNKMPEISIGRMF